VRAGRSAKNALAFRRSRSVELSVSHLIVLEVMRLDGCDMAGEQEFIPHRRCTGCGGQIVERTVCSVLRRPWHSTCLLCVTCRCQLVDRCLTRDGVSLYCRADFYRCARKSPRPQCPLGPHNNTSPPSYNQAKFRYGSRYKHSTVTGVVNFCGNLIAY